MKYETKKIQESGGGGSGHKSVRLGRDGLPMKYKKHKKHEHHHHQHKVRRVANEFDDLDDSMPAATIKREDNGSAPAGVSVTSKQALKKLLDHFLHLLQKRDSVGHFAQPVNPADAPGYYQMIKEPMDFSTMRIKLNAEKYSTLAAFKADFEKICHNACNYNTEDSDLFKYAQQFLMDGQKLLTQEKIQQMTPQAPFIREISIAELGFEITDKGMTDGYDEDDDDDVDNFIRRPAKQTAEQITPQDLLNQAKEAARGAADRLRIYKAKSRIGFIRQRDDGSTSLGFLPGATALLGGERPISLGALIGRVKQGTGSLQGYREDRRNLCKAVYPLYYGAYSSHGPSYDSTFATMTKEETDLVCNNADASALENVNVSHNVDYSTLIADHLLDVLTDNEHRAATDYVEEEKKLKEAEQKLFGGSATKAATRVPETTQTASDATTTPSGTSPAAGGPTTESGATARGEEPKVDFDSLKSLSDVGIDVSFLDSLQKNYETTPSSNDDKSTPVDSLTDTAALLNELKEVQLERLSAILPAHFSQILLPSDHEMSLASQIQTNLLEMTQAVRPGDVVPEEALRRMLGISFDGSEHRKNLVKVVNKPAAQEVEVVELDESAAKNPSDHPELIAELEIAAAEAEATADQSGDVEMVVE